MKNLWKSLAVVFITALMLFGCGTGDNPGNTPVTGITLDNAGIALSLAGGNLTKQLTARVLPANASNKAVTWASDDEEVATVSGNGLVTAVGFGDTTITATTRDGSFSAECVVRVISGAVVPVESVGFTTTATESYLAVGGAPLSLTASVIPANATLRTVKWTSGNPAVATVQAGVGSGLTATVIAVSAGNAIITVTTTEGGKTANYNITVTATAVPVTGVSLNETSVSLIADTTLQLNPIITPPEATNKAVTWRSSNTSIATVNLNGLVTAVANGDADITVTTTDGSFTDTCTVTVTGGGAPRNFVLVEGETLVHYGPNLAGVNHFGGDLGTTNNDGSYTFDGTAAQYSGGGAQYDFPTPGSGDTWKLSDYQVAEVFLEVTGGSVGVIVKKSGGNIDLNQYPGSGGQYLTLNSATGSSTFKGVIQEANAGIGFQRNNSGPATVKITKVVFSKVDVHTISFSGGGYTGMAAIEPIKVPDGRTVDFGGSYSMPLKPQRPGYTFIRWYNTTDSENFNPSTPVTKDLILSAQWEEGEKEPVDMKLNLDPASWGTLPANAANSSGGWTWPSEYAETDYTADILTLTFDGSNRQRAIIPLSTEQIEELMSSQEVGVTFRIVGTVKGEDGAESSAEFRCHLGNPSGTGAWNATDTGLQTSLKDHLVEYRSFASANKNATTLAWFMIQAMYYDTAAGNDTVQSGFPKVIITITSITIELGDTTQ
ncbi:MAG: Ig-like domain-containing protein [Treponema sp.]|jgi:uncharacterized repeat protein (TIGR02543 family)|nr:Ig-like domain-containing protein [Treponema sp.]